MLGRTMHAIAYDALHDEILVPHNFAQAILTFAGGATGETPPKRVIRGPKTQLIAHDRLAVDPVHDEIYVPDGDKVLVFPREGNGDVAPTRILTGPDTRIADANAVAIDPMRNLLVVTSTPSGQRAGERRVNDLIVFERTASGNAKPKRVITGVRGIPTIVSPQRGLILVVTDDAYVGVWRIDDEGEVPPRYTIGGPNGVLRHPRGVTIDPKNKAVIVSDKDLNAVLTFQVPEIFDTPTEESRR